MTWKDDLAIGVPAIDHQHKMLCDAIDRLVDACKGGKGREEILSTLSFLEQYTVRHFHDEELYQKQVNYPKQAEHKRLHEDFIAEVTRAKQELIQNGVTIVAMNKITSLVIDWLYNHIRKVDSELANYKAK